MERTFPPKSIVLVANTLGTITWGSADFSPRFNESIIKRQVAIRFSCQTTTGSSVNCGVRYSTLTKQYLVSERQTLFVIPSGGSAEITPASKPALGLLNDWITSISLDLTSATAGTVTVTLIIDDDPPPLSADPGQLIGLDARLNDDYLIIGGSAGGAFAPGVTLATMYTVPGGKRFFLDHYALNIEPSPSYPGLIEVIARLFFSGVNSDIYYYSLSSEYLTATPFMSFLTPLQSGDSVRYIVTNNDTVNRTVRFNFMGREVF